MKFTVLLIFIVCASACTEKKVGLAGVLSEKLSQSGDMSSGGVNSKHLQAEMNRLKASWNKDKNFEYGVSLRAFIEFYEKNKDELGGVCTDLASQYCEKTSKDIGVTTKEVLCLWKKVYRKSRESVPGLDDSNCEVLIRSHNN